MSWGQDGWGLNAWGLHTDSSAVADPLARIEADPELETSFLLSATPLDESAGAEVTVRVSSDGLSPAGVPWDEGLTKALNYSVNLFSEGRISGSTEAARGNTVVTNPDGVRDAWLDYNWVGRDIRLYLGLQGGAFPEDFALVGRAVAEGVNWGLDRIELRYRDLRFKLDVPAQTTTYTGAGGLEGGDDLKGKRKPTVEGRFQHVKPIPVDLANEIHQVNDGSMQAVSEVLDGGLALTLHDDVADIEAAGAPPSGTYSTSLATGYIRLGDQPESTVLVSGKGDNGGTHGYQETTAGIVRKVAVERTTLTDDDLDLGSFITLDADAPAPVGVATGQDETTVQNVLDEVVAERAWHLFTRTGNLRVGQVPVPSGESIDHVLEEDDLVDPSGRGTFKRTPAATPAWRISVGHSRYYETLSSSDILTSVTGDPRSDLQEEYRLEPAEDASIKGDATGTPEALDLELLTALATASDAAAEASRQLTLLGVRRDLYAVQPVRGLFQFSLGEIVQMLRPGDGRLGLTMGKRFVIVGITEIAGSPGQADAVTLRLWG